MFWIECKDFPSRISSRMLAILPLFWISSRMLTILPLFWGKCKGKRSVTDVRIYFLDGRREEVDRHVLIIISRNTVINKNTRQHWICMGGKRLVPELRHLSCFGQSELSLLCQYLQLFINSLEGNHEIKPCSPQSQRTWGRRGKRAFFRTIRWRLSIL